MQNTAKQETVKNDCSDRLLGPAVASCATSSRLVGQEDRLLGGAGPAEWQPLRGQDEGGWQVQPPGQGELRHGAGRDLRDGGEQRGLVSGEV